ncbi:MAG: alpha/beta hydrolase fold domain-containing protein [Oscillospiraceae bacterium]
MELHARLVRSQLNFFKPFVANCSLEVTRKGQDKLGELMTAMHRREVYVREHDFGAFQGAWITPHDQRRTGVILYLHGGGYTCGSLEYAKGFGATLAAEGGVRVFCAAYRLAPENRYPAALDDALESYQYLLKKGYAAHQILLCGESAGGGLIYARRLKLRELGLPLPCGLIGISPWTDLTESGETYETNREADPSMTKELLEFYAGCYTDDARDPLCSPLFGIWRGCRRRCCLSAGTRSCSTTRAACTKNSSRADARAGCSSRPSAGMRMCSITSARTWSRTSARSTAFSRRCSPRRRACAGCGSTTPRRSIPRPSAATGRISSACPRR